MQRRSESDFNGCECKKAKEGKEREGLAGKKEDDNMLTKRQETGRKSRIMTENERKGKWQRNPKQYQQK